MWLLLASHDLEDRRPVVLFGVTCGFGLLLKVSFPLFVALPFAHALWRSRHRAQALLTAAVPCLLLALPWYLVNGRRTIQNAIEAGYGESAIVQGADALVGRERKVHRNEAWRGTTDLESRPGEEVVEQAVHANR